MYKQINKNEEKSAIIRRWPQLLTRNPHDLLSKFLHSLVTALRAQALGSNTAVS
jgi:hypothetical protein